MSLNDSKPRKPVPTVSFTIQWLPGSPTSPFICTRTRSQDRFLSVWMWTGIICWYICSISECLFVCVCARVCLFVYVCVCFKSLQSCGAVDSPVLSDPLSYPTGIVSCSLACICCRHCENQSRLFRDGLDRMLIRHECFLVIGNYHNPVGILKISF